MQDLSNVSSTSALQLAPSAAGLPDGLAEKIASADVLILVGSSEANDLALTVETILASPEYMPGKVASHAFAFAVQDSHAELLRAVRGEPTDSQRYRAFRDFATMQEADPERYKAIDGMVQRFEEDNMAEFTKGTAAYMDRISDFLVHALAETAPLVQDKDPAKA